MKNTTKSSPNFRLNWLPATGGDDAPRDNSTASPVCGWLLHNKLDPSLLLFDRNGMLIVTILLSDNWRLETPPNNLDPQFSPEKIKNVHLRALTVWLLRKASQDTAFTEAFMEALDRSTEDNGNESDHSLSLLLGKPLALLRANISVNPSHEDAEMSFQLTAPDGGLATYWVEKSKQSYQDDTYYVASDEKSIVVRRDADRSSADPRGTTITMLLDPRSGIRATTRESASEPLVLSPDVYLEPMRVILDAFRISPKPMLNDWSWVDKKGNPIKKN